MRQADAPLTRITINLYAEDIAFLKDRYGAYQEIIRLLINKEVKRLKEKTNV